MLVTALGAGPVADLVRAGLAAAGVEVVDLLDGPGTPAVSTVLVTRATGERAVVSVNAVGGRRPERRGPRRLGVHAGATALLVDGHHLGAARVLAADAPRAASRCCSTAAAGSPGWTACSRTSTTRCCRPTSGSPTAPSDLLDRVADLGPRLVAQSAGAGPVRVRTVDADGRRASSVLHPPAVPAAEVVDTLGAGDVLHGATAASLATGHDVLAALADGVARASESVRHPGALGWVP